MTSDDAFSKSLGAFLMLAGVWLALSVLSIAYLIDPLLPDDEWWVEYRDQMVTRGGWRSLGWSFAMVTLGAWLALRVVKPKPTRRVENKEIG